MITTCQLLTIPARSPTLCFEKEALEFRAVSTFWDTKQHAWMNPQTPSPKKKNMPGFQKTYFFVGQVILTKLDRRSVGLSHGPPVILEPCKPVPTKAAFQVLSPDGHWQDIKASICEAPKHGSLRGDHPMGDSAWGFEPAIPLGDEWMVFYHLGMCCSGLR